MLIKFYGFNLFLLQKFRCLSGYYGIFINKPMSKQFQKTSKLLITYNIKASFYF